MNKITFLRIFRILNRIVTQKDVNSVVKPLKVEVHPFKGVLLLLFARYVRARARKLKIFLRKLTFQI